MLNRKLDNITNGTLARLTIAINQEVAIRVPYLPEAEAVKKIGDLFAGNSLAKSGRKKLHYYDFATLSQGSGKAVSSIN